MRNQVSHLDFISFDRQRVALGYNLNGKEGRAPSGNQIRFPMKRAHTFPHST